MKQLVTVDEAVEAAGQHTKPCSDCPFSRQALNGWLGNLSSQEWLRLAHGEAVIECHMLLGAQCAGASIYRANMCKLTRDPSVLKLPMDKERVFSTPREFIDHHAATPKVKQ